MKKSWILAAVLGIHTALFGYYDPSGDALCNACRELTAACDQLAGCHQEQCNPTFLPIEKTCYWGTLNFYGEYLWWKLNQEGLHYAITGVDNNTPEGELFTVDGQWNSGFRVGAAILFPCKAWKISLDWLKFNASDSDSAFNQPLTIRATRGLPASDIDTLDSANAAFQSKINSVRGALSVPLFTRAHVSLNPWLAIRADWLKTNFSIFYDGTGADFASFDQSVKFSGVGPEIGINGSWYLLPCFSVLGELKGASLYGDYDLHQSFVDNNGDEDVNFRYHRHRLQTTIGTLLGVQWEGCFFGNIFLRLKLGWETNIWFNFDKVYSFLSSSEEGNTAEIANDLTTSGVTFHAAISF